MKNSTRQALVAATDGGVMMEHMREFDRWTKHAGTPEERESLLYCEGVLQKYGYDTELIAMTKGTLTSVCVSSRLE